MQPEAMTRRARSGLCVAGVVMLVVAGLALAEPRMARASLDDRLALQASDVPGLLPVAPGRGGVETIALEVTAPSQLSRIDVSAFRSGRGARASRLESRVFAFRSAAAAGRSLAAWRTSIGRSSLVPVPEATAGVLTRRHGKRPD